MKTPISVAVLLEVAPRSHRHGRAAHELFGQLLFGARERGHPRSTFVAQKWGTKYRKLLECINMYHQNDGNEPCKSMGPSCLQCLL